jgi:hypothetical protein
VKRTGQFGGSGVSQLERRIYAIVDSKFIYDTCSKQMSESIGRCRHHFLAEKCSRAGRGFFSATGTELALNSSIVSEFI